MNSRPYEYSYLWTCPLIFKFVFNHFLSLSGVIKPCRLDCHATRDEFSSILFSVFMPLLVINIRANWLKPKTTCSFRFWLIFTSNGSFQINSTLIRLGSATPQKSVIMLISYGTVISWLILIRTQVIHESFADAKSITMPTSCPNIERENKIIQSTSYYLKN